MTRASLGPQLPEVAEEEEEGCRGPRLRRRVQFLLPPVTIQEPPPQQEEKAFHQSVEHLLGATLEGNFEGLFAADGWEDLLEEKSVRKLRVRGGQGQARGPQPGQEVTVKLLGALQDQSLVEKDPRLTFVLGQGEAVQALDLAVLSMRPGEVALILTRPAYAYGRLGRQPDIPAEAPLLYQVTLLQVRESPDLALLAAPQRLGLADRAREQGRFHFERQDYQLALRSYQRALRLLPSSPAAADGPQDQEVEEQEVELRQLRLKCLTSCAAAQLKLGRREAALDFCHEAERLEPDDAQALYWKGKLLAELGQDQAAAKLLKRALQLEPTAKAIHAELSRMARRQRGQPEPGGDVPGGPLSHSPAGPDQARTSLSPQNPVAAACVPDEGVACAAAGKAAAVSGLSALRQPQLSLSVAPHLSFP
uniref:Uncharacterized protein n=2 Tax=Sphaerodactylus townsendi TaxID=933632 RepID=A0ACB8E4V2_9SAUR